MAARGQRTAGGTAPTRSRWHLGRITGVMQTDLGPRFSGHHLKSQEADGKYVAYKEFDRHFTGLPLSQLRVRRTILLPSRVSTEHAGGRRARCCAAGGGACAVVQLLKLHLVVRPRRQHGRRARRGGARGDPAARGRPS